MSKLFVLVALAFCLLSVQAFDTINCGGFVKPSKELFELSGKKQLRDVQVEFLTDGTVHETTDCLPNGYFIIPIYEKESCSLRVKGPEGWHFSPLEKSIPAKDAVEPCSHNFQLTGFSVSGSVVTDGSCQTSQLSQPVSVKLIPIQVAVQATTQVVKTVNGKYHFENVFPGKYAVEVDATEMSFKTTSLEFSFDWDNVHVKESFVASGYPISGLVVDSKEKSGIAGVSFFLYSRGNKKIECEKKNVGLLKSGPEPNCGTVSGDDGKFSFNALPCGEYQVVAYYADETTVFDVLPKETTVLVDSTPRQDLSFLVGGFSIKGRVVGVNGEGLAGVTITNENDKKTVVTDAAGFYKLDQVVADTYNILASKKHFTFKSLTNFKITPQSSGLPDIVATHVDICGKVVISKPPSGISVGQRSIILRDSTKKETHVETDSDGYFCTKVIPGTYFLVPKIAPKELSAGLVLSDNEIEVTVASTPILDIYFEQARLMVSGKVKCRESPCDTSISVSLMGIGSQKDRVTTGLNMVHDNVGNGDGYFVFKDVFPGKYEVTIHHPNWCWQKETELIEVSSKDFTGVEFVQKGYLLLASSSHNLQVKAIPSKNPAKVQTIQLVKGENKFCFEEAEKYSLVADSCFEFEAPAFHFDTTKPAPVHFIAQKFKVTGEIVAADLAPSSTVTVQLTSSKHSSPIQLEPVLLSQASDSEQRFSYTYFAELGETVKVAASSNDLFFYPQSVSTTIQDSLCPEPLPVTKARKGIFLKGKVSPAGLKDLKVHILYEKDNKPALPVLSTDEHGNYVAGPLYDEEKYIVQVEKEGYLIQKVDDHHHVATKLGSISVQIDSLPGVLLSLSGNDGYTHNIQTDNNGFAKFTGLFPSEFYLRPLLKEYIFEPSLQEISIQEGEDKSVTFTSKRVAYSAFGTVRMLDGQAAKGVTISATSASGKTEATKTDNTGAFRLRGLIPSETYSIGVKITADGKLSRAEPSDLSFVISNNDIQDVNFIAFLRDEKSDVIGRVNTAQDLLSTLTVKVTREGQVVDEFSLGPNPVFVLPNLEIGKEHTVSFQTSLNPKENTFTLPSQTILVQEHNPVLSFDFVNTVKRNVQEIEIDNSPFLGPLFVMALGAGLFYRNEIKKYYLNFGKKEGTDSWNTYVGSQLNAKKRK